MAGSARFFEKNLQVSKIGSHGDCRTDNFLDNEGDPMKELKQTPLYCWHVEHGANMAPFGQYEMPLWYTGGAKAEHLAVAGGPEWIHEEICRQ